MPARILDGLKIRDEIFSELQSDIVKLHAQGIRPGLAAVLVGENPASQLYVRSKIAACEQLGIASWLHTPPAGVSTDYMLQLVRDLNADDNVDGILIQLPLPRKSIRSASSNPSIPRKTWTASIPSTWAGSSAIAPASWPARPPAAWKFFAAIKFHRRLQRRRPWPQRHCRQPVALLLLHANATVTICHSKTRDLPDVIRRADILVAAIGKAGYVQPDWIKPAAAGKPGAAVIDVGTNKVTDAAEAAQLLHNFPERLEKFRAKGNVLIGDVHPDAIQVAGALSPVPAASAP